MPLRSSVRQRITGFFWVGLLAGSTPSWAQELAHSSAKSAITFQIGIPISTPSGSIQTFMQANGLGGTSGFFGTSYPITKASPGLGLRIEFFRPRSSIGGDIHMLRGSVVGLNDALVKWQAVSLTPLYSYYSQQRSARISIGPSIQWLQTEAGTDLLTFNATPFLSFLSSASLIQQTRVMPGLVIDGAMRFPARSTLFVELGGRYEMAFGQIQNELILSRGQSNQRTLPFGVSFNRFMLTIGVGFQLGRNGR